MIKKYLMIVNSKDSCFSLWRFWIQGNLRLRKLRWIRTLLLILCLFTSSEVWPSTLRSHPILTHISIRLIYSVFSYKISNLVFLVVMIRWGRFKVIFSKIRKGFSIVLKLVNLLLLIYSTTPITPINRIIISIPQLNTHR